MRIVCENTYDLTSEKRIESQVAFRNSTARIRGYGGAMGGGKSRALCEEVFDWMLEYPGIMVPIFRQVHTHITSSTRKTFLEQVLPKELRARKDLVRIKNSGSDDLVEFLWNGSQVHFVGLDNPGKWFSTEIGAVAFDEAHEISEDDVLLLNARLRQRCSKCVTAGKADCEHMPYRMILTFNPSYPDHWLRHWFILGAERTEMGFHKNELRGTDSEGSLGTADYFVATAYDNKFNPPDYINRSLASFSKRKKQRYLDGLWLPDSGSFFDEEALARSMLDAAEHQPYLRSAVPLGDLTGLNKDDPPRLEERSGSNTEIFKPPIRAHVTSAGEEIKDHRYVVGVDASSGASADYSAIQVVDVTEAEQVAEWQGKVDPDLLAEAAFRIACVYNGAFLAPEITGGWGFAVTKRLQALIAGWHGPVDRKPSLYTRPIVDRLSQKFTDLIGWDTNTKSRALMLDTLEQQLRDGTLTIHGNRTLSECSAFAIPDRHGSVGEYRSPRAGKGAHDDLVMALAIAAFVASKLPRKTTLTSVRQQEPVFSVTGY